MEFDIQCSGCCTSGSINHIVTVVVIQYWRTHNGIRHIAVLLVEYFATAAHW
jgi:hypothetical protein